MNLVDGENVLHKFTLDHDSKANFDIGFSEDHNDHVYQDPVVDEWLAMESCSVHFTKVDDGNKGQDKVKTN